QSQRPNYERQNTQYVGICIRPVSGRGAYGFPERVNRACSDIAINDTQRTKRQRSGAGDRMSVLLLLCRLGTLLPVFTHARFSCAKLDGANTRSPDRVAMCFYHPAAFRKRCTVPAIPYSSASAVRPWPIDTSD